MSKLIWYHGGPKLTYLGSIKWDRPRNERDQNAAGPGMYWTLSEREATGYGEHLYRATTKPGFRMMPATRPTPAFVRKLFAAAGPARQRDFMEDWPDMTPAEALQNYLLRERTTIDAAVVLFHDLFRYNAADYVAAISTIYDGVRIAGRGVHNTADASGQHLVVWSPEKLTIDEARSTIANPSDDLADYLHGFYRRNPRLDRLRPVVREKTTPGPHGHPAATQRGDEIWLFPRFWPMPQSTRDHVMRHELGHWVSTQVGTAEMIQMASSLGLDLWDTNALPFGQFNMEEAFAEAFAEANRRPTEMQRKLPAWSRLVAEMTAALR